MEIGVSAENAEDGGKDEEKNLVLLAVLVVMMLLVRMRWGGNKSEREPPGWSTHPQ